MTSRWLACLVVAVACRTPQRSAAPPGGPQGTLVDSAALTGGFMARQRVTARYGEHTSSFEGVLQLHAGELTLVGLTPFGSKAFVLRQHGTDVSLDLIVPMDLAFPPEFVLLDIHRTLFISVGEAPLPDGVHTREREGERISESWQAGQLRQRRFERLDGDPDGAIVIDYEGGMSDGRLPARLTLDNAWFDYRLVIETYEWVPLGDSVAP